MTSINNRKGNENNKSTGVILKINPLAHRSPYTVMRHNRRININRLMRCRFRPLLLYVPPPLLYIPINHYKFEKERHQSMT